MKSFRSMAILWHVFFIVFILSRNSANGQWQGFRASDSSNASAKGQFRFYNEFIYPLVPEIKNIWHFFLGRDNPIVNTTNGFLRGVTQQSRDGRKYFAFLGVPYAEPPVGKLRFEPPVKLAGRWIGVRSARQHPPPCFHMDVFYSGNFHGVENCLFLNIYTKSIHRKAPVLVYIHGGGFVSGYASMYRAQYFLDEDVVLVMVQYRLAALGFLSTGDGRIRGNMAMKDQLLMLHYLKENIHNFGGDPNKVTLFGESAGAAMTQYHMLSHRSQGLFHKGISSGVTRNLGAPGQ